MTGSQTFTPREVVSELDRYIVGQDEAKRAVAIALRNRWRRLQVPEELRDEIAPKNIIMIGPTGVGKTEVARRLARLSQAPFIKVEASKFTEVGYVGRDVESIIRDLTELAISMVSEEQTRGVRVQAEELAEDRVLGALLPTPVGAPGQPPRDFGLPHARRADHDDVLRRDLVAQLLGNLLAAPAVAQGDGHGALRLVLPDDVAVEFGDDFARRKGLQLAHGSVTTVTWSLV